MGADGLHIQIHLFTHHSKALSTPLDPKGSGCGLAEPPDLESEPRVESNIIQCSWQAAK